VRLALLLWSGSGGGAETHTANLAGALRRLGAEASVLFVTSAGTLAERLRDAGVPWEVLGHSRGRGVLLRPRRLARRATELGPDGVLTPSPGYLPAALRLGGYRGRIAAVNHGRILQLDREPAARRLVRRADRASGFWAADVEVAVSAAIAARLERERFRARRVVTIPNGVDVDVPPPNGVPAARPFTVGWAGRFVPGKGVDVLVRGFASAGLDEARLVLGGDGPERSQAEALARDLGVAETVEFPGWVESGPGFWQGCDLAVAPPDGWRESFGMSALEAMAAGLPVVATRNGGLVELVEDGVTGRLVEAGDAQGLAEAIRDYAAEPDLRRDHGRAARRRAEDRFAIERTAAGYLGLFGAAS
jgi:glycosyltransferase involved in cell wall biosynthesis